MKKWCIKVVSLWFLLVVLWGATVYVVDPFFHFHAPFDGIYYDLSNSGFKNDGMAKNFKYNAIITGTSTSQKYSVTEADNLLGKDFILLSYPGEGFYRISEGIRTALDSGNDMDLVLWSLDPMWFISDDTYEGHADEGYPEYLYNDNVFDDFTYLYNMDLMVKEVIPVIDKTLKRKAPVSFYTNENDLSDVEMKYERGQRENIKVDENENQAYLDCVAGNIERNLIELIKEYPDTEFYFVIAPYNIAWWDSLNQISGDVLERRLELERYVVSTLIEYENVRVFSFNNDYNLVCDTTSYIDSVHPNGRIPSYILQAISRGDNQITKDNCEEYFSKEWEFYTSFDYNSVFENY